jgi:chromosome segregation ATPase
MAQQTERPDDTGPDLDQTAELLPLDVAAYEQRPGSLNGNGLDEPAGPGPAAAAGEQAERQTLAALPSTETLRDVEAWIAAHEARVHSFERAVAELQEARNTARARVATLAGELEVARHALAAALARADEGERAARDQAAVAESAAAGVVELRTELEQRSGRTTQLEAEVADLRTRLSAAGGELAQRDERLAASVSVNERQQTRLDDIVRERDTLAQRVARLLEGRRSREWKRNFWQATWRALDADLAEARTVLQRAEAERAGFAATVAKVTAELVERDAAIAQLRTDLAARVSALEELTATRTREQLDSRELAERYRGSTESLAALEQQLAESRAAGLALEETLRTAQSSETAHVARATELEGLAGNLSRALQAQTEAAQHAGESLAARERELAEARTRAAAVEAGLQTATRQLTEQVALTGKEEAARRALEDELAGARLGLQRETERVSAAEAAQRQLALELEHTRGVLEEREQQLRRLDRYASASAQVLSRIKVGIARRESSPLVESLKLPEYGGALVSLDDGEAPPLTLGRYTTIGRAPESDVCLKDWSISRRHAVVTIGPSGAFIEDLRSVNGVTVNHQRVRHARLADGDVVELGGKRYRFCTTPPGDPAAEVTAAELEATASLGAPAGDGPACNSNDAAGQWNSASARTSMLWRGGTEG